MRLSRNTKSISAAVVYSRGGYAAVQKSAFLMFYMRSYAKPNCKKIGFSKYKLDGYSGFVFTNRFDNLYNQGCLNKQIERIRQAYNREEEIKAKREERRPLLLPHFTNHQLRHTFCSRLCEQDVNVKLIQEVMGHADVSTTFDIYAEFSTKKKKEAFKLLDNGSIIKTQKKAR